MRRSPSIDQIASKKILIFSYSQPGPIPLTIENVLFNALVKVGAVSQDNADNPTKVRVVINE